MGKIVQAQKLSLLFSLFLLLPPMTHGAEVETELEGIKKKIEKERQGITKVQEEEGSVLRGLEKVEKELDRKKKALGQINSKLESVLVELQKKEKLAEKISSSLRVRKELLKRRARSLYKWQRGGSPFILLNEGLSVAVLMQRRRYLELMLAYDRELVNHLRRQSVRQEALKKELAQKRKDVDRERKALFRVKELIRLEREKKREILSSLRREKKARVRALRELEQAAHRLQKMMEEISQELAMKSRELPAGISFELMRGKLDYPVRGKVLGGFGKRKHPEFSAEIFRKGIDIEAPLGEEIRAVGGGKVVFADRLLGYGKMMVIDHGDRYYTIYAHLSDLLKGTGQLVQVGEPIALVGDSDSLTGARLYFEIRKGGKPLDPLPWFRSP